MTPYRSTEFEMMQKIFLGGQVSQAHTIFKDLALMSPDFAEMWLILEKIPSFLEITEPLEFLKALLKLLGQSESMKSYDQLTRLSMILGDTRKWFKAKKDVPISNGP